MKVRIISKGWETFTGTMGFQATFTDGVSDNDLDARQVARIGASLQIVDIETGLQVGPAEVARMLQAREMDFVPTHVPEEVPVVPVKDDTEALAAAAEAQKEADAAALAAAREKEEKAADEELVIYSRQELEAIGANDGINGLRDIAKPLGVRARAIDELIREILVAQNAKVQG